MILSNAKDIKLGSQQVLKVLRNNQVIWQIKQSANLFDINSKWAVERACNFITGQLRAEGAPRLTFFMRVKPNTTYQYTADIAGDMFRVFASDTELTYPPSDSLTAYRIVLQSAGTIEKEYTFTTNATDKWVWLYLALNKRPTNIKIVEL